MMHRWVLLAALLAVPVDAKPARGPIATINAVIGDASASELDNRASPELESSRIRQHLLHVERRLRGVDVEAWPVKLREARRLNLDRLRDYRIAGIFPRGVRARGRLPTFVDNSGRHCAVADLLLRSQGPTLVATINDSFNHAYLDEINSPAFDRWAARSGLSRLELAMIQPTYSYSDPPSQRTAVELGFEQLFDSERSDGAASMATATAAIWFAGDWGSHEHNFGIEATLGWANTARLVVRAQTYLGLVTFRPPGGAAAGVRVGVGVDGITNAVESTLRVPAELFWNFWWLELRASVSPIVSGADLPLAWRGTLRFYDVLNLLSERKSYLQLSFGRRYGAFSAAVSLGFGANGSGAISQEWREFP